MTSLAVILKFFLEKLYLRCRVHLYSFQNINIVLWGYFETINVFIAFS